MKKRLLFLLLCLSFFSCKQEPGCEQNAGNEQAKEEEPSEPNIEYPNNGHIFNASITACNVKDPIKNNPWLKELVEAAEQDNVGVLSGTVWLENYKGSDVFVTDIMLEAGTIYYSIIDCSGKMILPDKNNAEEWLAYNAFLGSIKLDVVVYSNVSGKEPEKPDSGHIFNHAVTACGTQDLIKNNPRLAWWINKAEKDRTLNYLGTIWLVTYQGQDLFVTDMALGSGGVRYWFFDCNGYHFEPEDSHAFEAFLMDTMKLDVIVYSNFKFSH